MCDNENNELEECMNDKDKWYGDAQTYWDKVEPSVQGMLQGYAKISDKDCNGSQEFIKHLKKENILKTNCHRALDCGAGIGRVSKHFLLKVFDVVDLLEQCTEFTNNIHKYMKDEKLSSRIEKIYNEGMQTFHPCPGHYDVIWIQWVIGHLTNDDCVAFLQRCKQGLKKGGCICIKDNVASTHENVIDKEDSSVTRSLDSFQTIFEKAGMKIEESQVQKGFPKDLFPVRIFALT